MTEKWARNGIEGKVLARAGELDEELGRYDDE
jgi:hypothetical protein